MQGDILRLAAGRGYGTDVLGNHLDWTSAEGLAVVWGTGLDAPLHCVKSSFSIVKAFSVSGSWDHCLCIYCICISPKPHSLTEKRRHLSNLSWQNSVWLRRSPCQSQTSLQQQAPKRRDHAVNKELCCLCNYQLEEEGTKHESLWRAQAKLWMIS